MKRVLVTGAGGFVGRHCLPILVARGFDVHGVLSPRNLSSGLPHDVQLHAVDLFEDRAVEQLVHTVQPDHLLHLAWIATPGEYWTSPANLDWVAASLRLLRTFGAAGGRRVVMTGSCAEYDWQSGYCTEGVTAIQPTALYGQSKQTLQTLLESFALRTGLSAAWARLFFLYGPHASVRRLPGAVIEPLLRGEMARCSSGEQLRDYLYIADAAEALCRLVDSDVGGAINISAGKPILLKEMIRTCAGLIGREDLLAWGAHPGGQEPPLVVGDNRRLREELAWTPQVSLAEGLRRTIAWWRQDPGECRAAA